MAAAAGALALGGARAQVDPKPKHGGVMSRGDHDIVAELVVQADRLVVYVEADDKPVATAGADGTLRRLARSRAPEQTVTLTPAGDNTLSGAGLKLARGDQVRAYVRFANGREQSFAFTYWK
jgi:hypothetical protein